MDSGIFVNRRILEGPGHKSELLASKLQFLGLDLRPFD